ncbi:MAG: rhomboid family intramembrane serine protease [Bacillota bacterium]|nr:rhomboid family intramembrane serine protease [Bacillota bacterium]
MNNQLDKTIIELLCQHFDYKLDEFRNNRNSISFWGCHNDKFENHNFLVFSNEEHFDYINNAENALNLGIKDSDKVSLVLIINDDKKLECYTSKLVNSNIIIISKTKRSILYFTNEIQQIALSIQSILDYLNRINKRTRKPVITYGIIVINIIMFMIEAYLSGNPLDIDINILSFLGAKNNVLISQGQYFRLITAMFLHGGLVHIALNMYSLYSVGPLVEEVYGRNKYIIIYLLTGIAASLSSFIFSPNTISVGASGAIFGLLGAVLIFGFRMKDKIGKGFYRNILSVIVINVFIGLTLPNIDNYAHMGGLAAGILLSNVLFPSGSNQ